MMRFTQLLVVLLTTSCFGQGELQSATIQVKFAMPSQIAICFGQPFLRGGVIEFPQAAGMFPLPEGVRTFLADDSTGRIVAQGTAIGLAELARLVLLLDAESPQIEVSLKILKQGSFRSDGAWSSVLMSPVLPEDQSFRFWFRNVSSETEFSANQEMRVVCLSGIRANLFLSKSFPAILNRKIVVLSSGEVIGSSIVAVNSIAALNCTPIAVGTQPNRRVIIDINPVIQEVVGWAQVDGLRAPILSLMSLHSKLILQDGVPIVIGGLTRSGSSAERTRFSFVSDSSNREEITMVLSARILS